MSKKEKLELAIYEWYGVYKYCLYTGNIKSLEAVSNKIKELESDYSLQN
mgnify:CR=1 FL=1